MSILTKPAQELLEANVLDSKLHKRVGKELLKEWNIPLGITNDLLTLRKSPAEVSDYILYHIICAINERVLPKGYPPEHLKESFERKYSDEKVILPIIFKMVQISEDQWIGKTTFREIFKLGNSMLINYNENAQRVMKRIETDNGDRFEIRLNKRAISKIENALNNKRYIPNTITLNIPADDNSDFFYDEDINELTIKRINMFDILDGYHRYVAINRVCSLDPNYDHPIELRITNFSDEKSRQFIWQEDQKTHMSKIDSASLNKYDVTNIIVKKIQDSTYGTLIQYNRGIISSSVLSNAIRIIYNISSTKNYSFSAIAGVSNDIINGFNKITEAIPDIFDAPLSPTEIYCLVMMVKNQIYDKKTYGKLKKITNEVIEGRDLKKISYERIMNKLRGGK